MHILSMLRDMQTASQVHIEEIDATSIKIFVPEYDETSTNYVNAATPLRYTIDPNAVLMLVSPHWRTGWKV